MELKIDKTESHPTPADPVIVADTVAVEQELLAAVTRPQLPAIRVPTRHNATLAALLERINADRELINLWRCANVNSVDRAGRSDHGRVHVQIVANIALKVLRQLTEAGVRPSVVKDYGLANDDAEVVVVLASLLHDVGIAVHRHEHEHHSLFVASPKAKELLDGVYDIEPRTILWSEIMHAIIGHHRDETCLTVEAGVVKVADALDMAKGRSRIPFESGKVNIHSLSAAAIDRVIIEQGDDRPVRITINMTNSAGIFQVDELLKHKLSTSGLAGHIEVIATIHGEQEKRLVEVFRL